MTEPLLRARGLRKRFGRLVVLDQLDLDVRPREVLGIVGPNGAGKSTLLDLLSGVLPADEGSVRFAGNDVTHLAPAERSRAGLARTFQVPRPFAGLTAFENVLVAATFAAGRKGDRAHAAAFRALDTVGLAGRANERAGTLRLLDRKRLELARALATEPLVLLLDEIAGGLSDAELPELVSTIRRLRGQGISVVWVEHIVHALLAAVDRLVCLAGGRELASGDPRTVLRDPRVVEVYLGSTVEAA